MPDIVELERQIGLPPGDPNLRITPRTKGLVQQWMIAHGLDPARVDASREKTIRRAYVDPRYLRQLQTRRDYNPEAGKDDDVTGKDHWIMKPPAAVAPRSTQAPAQPDVMMAFAAAMQAMMPPGVTEERVLQLIYDHVPGLIRLTLADILGDVSTKLTATDDEEC